MNKDVIALVKDEDGNEQALFACPGCGCAHAPRINGRGSPNWGFNKDLVKPTFTPSILVRGVDIPDNPEKDARGNYMLGADGRMKGAKDSVCHSFVTDGRIQFLGDCTHELKNKTVELKPI